MIAAGGHESPGQTISPYGLPLAHKSFNSRDTLL